MAPPLEPLLNTTLPTTTITMYSLVGMAKSFLDFISFLVPPPPPLNWLLTLGNLLSTHQPLLASLAILLPLPLYPFSHPTLGPQVLFLTSFIQSFFLFLASIIGPDSWLTGRASVLPRASDIPLWVLPLCKFGEDFGHALTQDGGPLRSRFTWEDEYWRSTTGRSIQTTVSLWLLQYIWYKTEWGARWKAFAMVCAWMVPVLVLVPDIEGIDGLDWFGGLKKKVFEWMTRPQRRYWERRDLERDREQGFGIVRDVETVGELPGEGDVVRGYKGWEMGVATTLMRVFGFGTFAMQMFGIWGKMKGHYGEEETVE
ncbi:hypothetical protein B0T21DRAFT_443879 [Apiosordaria backusii]|uniref:Uncharacterized protein n=1 Tax=Apiosordaria backusii TaxID=314023 RepID=A0AA40EBZ0_9PEZI|nr:hypothetical protein B0T21DRAFT_443879 [Apiosordaria backusii]